VQVLLGPLTQPGDRNSCNLRGTTSLSSRTTSGRNKSTSWSTTASLSYAKYPQYRSLTWNKRPSKWLIVSNTTSWRFLSPRISDMLRYLTSAIQLIWAPGHYTHFTQPLLYPLSTPFMLTRRLAAFCISNSTTYATNGQPLYILVSFHHSGWHLHLSWRSAIDSTVQVSLKGGGMQISL